MMAEGRELTLDDLAVMVSRGFSDAREQFTTLRAELKQEISDVHTELKQEISEVGAEVGYLKTQVTGVRHEVTGLRVELTGFRDEVERRFDGVSNRFDRMERDMAEVKYLLTDVVRRDEFLGLKQRVEVVERHLGLKSEG